MQSTAPTATILPPGQGKTFSFLGNTVTYKFTDNGQKNRLYEMTSTASSGIPPLHTHPWDECFYFLEGEVSFQVGDRWIQATPGYVINLPAGIPHTFRVKSSQAKFLIGLSSPAAERYIEELCEVGRNQEPTLEQIKRISENHRIHYIH